MLSRGVVSAVGHLQLPQLVLALSWSLLSLCSLPYSELLCPMKPLQGWTGGQHCPIPSPSYRLGSHIHPAAESPPGQDIRWWGGGRGGWSQPKQLGTLEDCIGKWGAPEWGEMVAPHQGKRFSWPLSRGNHRDLQDQDQANGKQVEC